MSVTTDEFRSVLDTAERALRAALEHTPCGPGVQEIGRVVEIGEGLARVSGLPGVGSEELVRFPGRHFGMAFDLGPDEVLVVLLDPATDLGAGAVARRTGRVLDVPVGAALLGRVVDALGRPLDGRGPLRAVERLPIERPAPAIFERAPVRTPLQTGIRVIDALFPIGRGQRELIVGDRQTGKTAIAVDAILAQRETEVVCIYCAIGKRTAAVADVIADLGAHGALEYTAVVTATAEDPPGLRFATPYAATSMAEYFMHKGRDVLLVMDDLTRHARAYRELSLLMRRPPGREAYPGDVFYIHSRLLERATHLRGDEGGSLTVLPIVETQAEDISAYIPTNLISITDGQIYLSPRLFRQNQLPAVDIGRSVSRVGGKAQLPAYASVVGDLRLAHSQFEELERFSRYGARLEEEQRRRLEHGRRMREALKQDQYAPVSPGEQIAVLVALTDGLFDDLDLGQVGAARESVQRHAARTRTELLQRLEAGAELEDDDRRSLREAAEEALAEHSEEAPDGVGARSA